SSPLSSHTPPHAGQRSTVTPCWSWAARRSPHFGQRPFARSRISCSGVAPLLWRSFSRSAFSRSAKYRSSSAFSRWRSFSPRRSLSSIVWSPRQVTNAVVHAVAQAAGPRELAAEQSEAEEDQEQPGSGHERDREHDPDQDQSGADRDPRR